MRRWQAQQGPWARYSEAGRLQSVVKVWAAGIEQHILVLANMVADESLT